MNKIIFGKVGSSFFEVNITTISNIEPPTGYVLMSEERPNLNFIVKDNGNGTGDWVIDLNCISSDLI
ncbi:hypothetical protein [Orbus mooreae]|uniref:hypothetical protein n=1 Tax=Orbus mooreae TaxID=3074107 RepID=UPI00370DA26F